MGLPLNDAPKAIAARIMDRFHTREVQSSIAGYFAYPEYANLPRLSVAEQGLAYPGLHNVMDLVIAIRSPQYLLFSFCLQKESLNSEAKH